LTVFWISSETVRLAIVSRPRGFDWLAEDVQSLRAEAVEVLVSALTAGEREDLGLAQEAECCRRQGLDFVSFPIEDRRVPASAEEFHRLLDQLQRQIEAGRSIAIHCRAGIGRSSMIAAGLLLRNGFSVETAFRALEQARGFPVPDTPEQRAWIETFAANPSERAAGYNNGTENHE
jgi:protein-tyrosine phosphatase